MFPSDDGVFVYLVAAVSEAGRGLPQATASDHWAWPDEAIQSQRERIYNTQYRLDTFVA